jgi:cyclohexyl-isocyanide hydratase
MSKLQPTTRRETLKYMSLGILAMKLPFTLPLPTKPMRIAYILFDGITILDFVGIYDPLSRIKSKKYIEDFTWDLCGMSDFIQDGFGLKVGIDKIKPDLSVYDMVIIPGGFGTRKLQFDAEFIDWIRTAKNVTYKVSVCTGSLLLGSAGFLKNKTATTNFNEYKTLENYCDDVVKYRIVDDGNVITAGAVASSLDLGLYLCEKLVGSEKTEEIRKSMNYIPSQFEIRK